MTPPSVCVITGATGHANLAKCIRSVQRQTYEPLEHLVVIDGPDRAEAVTSAIATLATPDRVKALLLPHATGRDNWNGHRIYGAMPMLVLSDYVCWLDEDNSFEPDHVASLVATVTASGAGWAFALRRLVDATGKELALDQCESLGNLHSTYLDPRDHLVDTSCYLVRRDLAIQTAAIWNRPGRCRGNAGPDRLLCQLLMQLDRNARCTGRYTVNYAIGNRFNSVKLDFFLHGNAAMRAKYPDGLPWEK